MFSGHSGEAPSWAEAQTGPQGASGAALLASLRGVRRLSSHPLPERGWGCFLPLSVIYTHGLLRDGKVTRFAWPIIVEKIKQAHFIPVTFNLQP